MINLLYIIAVGGHKMDFILEIFVTDILLSQNTFKYLPCLSLTTSILISWLRYIILI